MGAYQPAFIAGRLVQGNKCMRLGSCNGNRCTGRPVGFRVLCSNSGVLGVGGFVSVTWSVYFLDGLVDVEQPQQLQQYIKMQQYIMMQQRR